MHPENPHRNPYDFDELGSANPNLNAFVFTNKHGNQTVDFANPEAVFELNKALLLHHYRLENYSLPVGYLCPAIPGRADYLCHLKTLLNDDFGANKKKQPSKVLDVGVGANCVYPIIGAQHFRWDMVGIDIHLASVASANEIVASNAGLSKKVEIRYQDNNANIFREAIQKNEFFDATICNPPFHASEEDATRGTARKVANLSKGKNAPNKTTLSQNFGGKANELWCNGGEALFIKRMIKESILFKEQVGVFTTLVSNKANLSKLKKQLDKAKASQKTIVMNIGNKESRILIWFWNEPKK